MKARTIKIVSLDNKSYLVTVGCKMLAFESLGGLLEQVEAYLRDPSAVEARFAAKYEWATMGQGTPTSSDFNNFVGSDVDVAGPMVAGIR